MGFLKNQIPQVIEWTNEEETIFWKWPYDEIKKGSRLIIRPGQDAIFLHSGRIDGIFENSGDYDVESEIVPFLSILKSFKFGFSSSGMKAEIIFINTNVFTLKWGTRSPVNIQAPGCPGGMPIRANGTVQFRIEDKTALMENVAGTRDEYKTSDVKQRIVTVIEPLLMKWITKEGKDMFNLQMNAVEIGEGITSDLNVKLMDTGLRIDSFNIESFNYPENVQNMINKNAELNMIGDVNRYQQVQFSDAMASGKLNNSGAGTASSMASDMAGMMMGMNMANQMMNNMGMNNNMQGMQQNAGMQNNNMQQQNAGGAVPNFCPNCGSKTNGANFCPNCGNKLI